MDVGKFLADLANKYPHIIQDVNMFNNNVSVTAPSLVPDMSSANTVDVGGREPYSQQCILAGIIPPPDVVRKSNQENPPLPMFESAEDLIDRSRSKGFSHSYLPEKGELPPSQRIIGTQSNAVVTADSGDRDIRVDLGKFESNLVSAHNVVTSTGSSGIGVGSVRERVASRLP